MHQARNSMPKSIFSAVYLFLLTVSLNIFTTLAIAQQDSPDYSWSSVKKILDTHCVLCHNDELASGRLEGGYKLTSYDEVLRLVVPGHPIKSALFTFANVDLMPEGDRPKLSSEEKDILYFWIYHGASNNAVFDRDWQWINQNVIRNYCADCHAENKNPGIIALDFSSNENYDALSNYLDDELQRIINNNRASHPAIEIPALLLANVNTWLDEGALNSLQAKPNWQWINENIFQKQCRVCHDGQSTHLDSYENIMKLITPGNAADSPLYGAVASGFMPQNIPLEAKEIEAIFEWIENGAKP